MLMLLQDTKSPGPLGPRNQARLHFCWKQYKKCDVFKYPKVFQRDNGPEFKKEVTKLPEKHSSDIRRATTKYKDTHTAFVQASHKELVK